MAVEIKVISRRDGEIINTSTHDITRKLEELRAREARHNAARPARIPRSEDSIISEIAWKICGPDWDADDAEASRWDVEIVRKIIT